MEPRAPRRARKPPAVKKRSPSGQGQTHGEGRALALDAGHAHLALHAQDQVLHDREPQARPAGGARARLVDAVEALEDPVEVAARDADARVLHRDQAVAVLTGEPQRDAPGRARVLDRVVDQVVEHLRHGLLVAAHPQGALAAPDLEAQALRRQGWLAQAQHAVEHLAPVDRRALDRELARLDARQAEEVGHQVGQPLHVGVDALKELDVVALVVQRAREQRLDEALDRGQRGLQLVRDVGDEVAPDALQAPQLRDVVQHDDEAALAAALEGAGVDLEDALLPAPEEVDLERLLAARRARAPEQVLELLDRREVPQAPAHGGGRDDLEQRARGLVDEGHAVLLVHRHDALDHARQHGAELRVLLGERRDAARDLGPELVQGLAQEADLVGPRDAHAALVAPGGEFARDARHGGDRARDPARDEEPEEERDEDARARAEHDRARGGAELALDEAHGQPGAHEPERLARLLDAKGHVQELVADRVREAARDADALALRL